MIHAAGRVGRVNYAPTTCAITSRRCTAQTEHQPWRVAQVRKHALPEASLQPADRHLLREYVFAPNGHTPDSEHYLLFSADHGEQVRLIYLGAIG